MKSLFLAAATITRLGTRTTVDVLLETEVDRCRIGIGRCRCWRTGDRTDEEGGKKPDEDLGIEHCALCFVNSQRVLRRVGLNGGCVAGLLADGKG